MVKYLCFSMYPHTKTTMNIFLPPAIILKSINYHTTDAQKCYVKLVIKLKHL